MILLADIEDSEVTGEFDISSLNRVRQLREKADYDRETVHAVLDAGLIAHVAFIDNGVPIVQPMLYARSGGSVLLHGARKARIIRMLASEAPVSINVTIIDAIVAARSAFNSSMNYRSATAFGKPRLLEGYEEKQSALRIMSEHLMPGRWDELRAPHEREIKMTGVIEVVVESASAKVSAGMPDDEDADYALPVWAGIVPIVQRPEAPLSDPELPENTRVSPSIARLAGHPIDR